MVTLAPAVLVPKQQAALVAPQQVRQSVEQLPVLLALAWARLSVEPRARQPVVQPRAMIQMMSLRPQPVAVQVLLLVQHWAP
jgi:hypothetical protein